MLYKENIATSYEASEASSNSKCGDLNVIDIGVHGKLQRQ